MLSNQFRQMTFDKKAEETHDCFACTPRLAVQGTDVRHRTAGRAGIERRVAKAHHSRDRSTPREVHHSHERAGLAASRKEPLDWSRHQRSSPMVGTSHYIARVHGTKDVVHVPRCVLCRIRDNLHQVARIEAVRSNSTRAHGRSRPAVSARILHQVLPVGPSLSNGPLHQQGAVFFVLKKR